MTQDPQRVTKKDWAEIARVEAVRVLYGIENKADERDFAGRPFGAKFNYMSDGPGYAGDLFVLLGGEPECPPLVLIRRKGKLEVVDSSGY